MKQIPTIFYLSILSFLILFGACGREKAQIDKTTENGVEVVINHFKPYKISGKSSLALEEILKIDTEDEEIANLGIPDILGFEVNSFGEIYILRTIKGEGDFIFKFDSNGKFVKSFGPQGQGPGEFQNPHHIALDSEDNIVIIDLARGILLKYDKDGVFINDNKLASGDIRVTSGPRANLLVMGHSFERDKEKALNTYSLKLLNPNLEVLKVIDKFSFEWRPDKAKATEPVFCWSASHDNIYVANEDRGYDIWVYDFDGKLIRKIQKECRQIPISEDYKKKALKQYPKDMRNMLYFPEFHPPFQSIASGDDGMLLVSTFERGKNPGEFMVDIFNEDGVFIGRKSLNIFVWESHLWAKIKADKFYCLKEKDAGYKELVVYKMIWQ